ncbi:BZ3500_MvSof-1268-A1-R1_Chr4-2g07176 [Microbotryum saponariae]|uniref:BZ3500_MvSof-1268-A1-R1_Chr4-2g07176 protein n=1 Tax=Microbotryum saponariae TaxID=289078 RepID=A0A2X0LEV8_9BASI|nr:BZ3500_MvSof-1268-A1-R1_Chr4-2g07176 [Microbotryum saponariae]SDA06841.1 BZ3501_MvSof-1269-A2-R1_Chr4-2g06887 [Microbotryum saponariae]
MHCPTHRGCRLPQFGHVDRSRTDHNLHARTELTVASPLCIGYPDLVFLFGSLAVFSRFYRKAQNSQSKPLKPHTSRRDVRVSLDLSVHHCRRNPDMSLQAPTEKAVEKSWFPQHKSRDIYVSLLSLDPAPPRPILIAALLRRAMDDVKLIWTIRDSKQALQTLLTKGQIGDDLWERFQEAEKELEAEIVEVVQEANTFQEGYGQQIFGLASEMVGHEKFKEAYDKIAENRKIEEAKIAAGPASNILAPTTYLTPSSLTLAPSNPLVASFATSDEPSHAHSTDGPESTPAPASADEHAGHSHSHGDGDDHSHSHSHSQAPLEARTTTTKPPSPVVTPSKGKKPSSKNASKNNSNDEDDDEVDEDEDIDVPMPVAGTKNGDAAATSNKSTPSATPSKGHTPAKANKKGAIKKKVKGGR